MFLLLTALLDCNAQSSAPRKPLSLVMPNAKGRIVIPAGADFKWQLINLYDNGTRPVFQLTNNTSHLDISYALFPNTTGSAAPKVCRDDVIEAAIRSLSPVPGLVEVKQRKTFDQTTASGSTVAAGSFFVESLGGARIAQQNLFGVLSSPTVCAEIHISKTPYTPADDAAMNAALQDFSFDAEYAPTPQDYFTLGSVLYQASKAYASAAFYYQRALDTFPSDAPLTARRVLTDQLAMAYGISGQIKQSRSVNEAAIKADPDYPLYYYNLACADAEQGKAADAKLHLQQAFDRKANTLPGEKLPDPTQDDSIQKLKKNKEFWTFLQTLK